MDDKMRIISRVAGGAAAIAALVYGGLWGYSWYKVKTVMDSAVKQSAPIAEIKYSSIYVSPKLDGTVGVDGIVIRPKMSDDEFKVQSVRLSLPGVIELLAARKDEIPESVHLSVSGIGVDLNSPLLVSLNNMQKEAITQQGRGGFSLGSAETLGCGSVDSIGIEELTRMGYQRMDIDIDTEYRYTKITNLLNVSGVVRVRDMQSLDVKAEMRVPPTELAQGNFSNLVLDTLGVDIIDSGYAPRRNRFCAAQLGSTEEAYLAKNIELLSQKLGTTFPLETVEAYKKVMQGGRMHIGLTPKSGIELKQLERYALKDALEVLGVKLVLASHEVDFGKFEWGKVYATVAPGREDDAETTSAPSAPVPATPTYVPASYHATAPAKLGRYVGYKVRLTTRAGLDRDGVITAAEGGTITLQQAASAGKGFISFPIALADITSAQVLY